jgi:hypothetical protein
LFSEILEQLNQTFEHSNQRIDQLVSGQVDNKTRWIINEDNANTDQGVDSSAIQGSENLISIFKQQPLFSKVQAHGTNTVNIDYHQNIIIQIFNNKLPTAVGTTERLNGSAGVTTESSTSTAVGPIKRFDVVAVGTTESSNVTTGAKNNPCQPNPCKNNGICKVNEIKGNRDYMCQCQSPMEGVAFDKLI